MDQKNHRLIGSDERGFRCIIGCETGEGSKAEQLTNHHQFAFDRDGNIYVADFGNNRVQKFELMTNSCGEFT
jgi:DNA-binding beta-propeller fold protein YncE